MDEQATTMTLHGPFITFHFVDAPDETYVLSGLIKALAEFARTSSVKEGQRVVEKMTNERKRAEDFVRSSKDLLDHLGIKEGSPEFKYICSKYLWFDATLAAKGVDNHTRDVVGTVYVHDVACILSEVTRND